jgi:hypothetical protein
LLRLEFFWFSRSRRFLLFPWPCFSLHPLCGYLGQFRRDDWEDCTHISQISLLFVYMLSYFFPNFLSKFSFSFLKQELFTFSVIITRKSSRVRRFCSTAAAANWMGKKRIDELCSPWWNAWRNSRHGWGLLGSKLPWTKWNSHKLQHKCGNWWSINRIETSTALGSRTIRIPMCSCDVCLIFHVEFTQISRSGENQGILYTSQWFCAVIQQVNDRFIRKLMIISLDLQQCLELWLFCQHSLLPKTKRKAATRCMTTVKNDLSASWEVSECEHV